MVLPRFAAISAGELIASSALIVARTTLYGFVGPWHFARMLVTPTTSNTARIAPPAITPVPSDAGCICTRVEPCRPSTAWCSVPFLRRTFTILRRACSIAFCTATGTSFALPLPMPMRPSPSPTTVSAAKPRMRPPFTTLVTRLIEIIFSRNPSPRSSCCCGWRGFERCCAMNAIPRSELEAAFAGGVGQRLHAAMEAITGAIERDGLDAERFRTLRDALADHGGGGPVAAVLHVVAHVGLERRRACEHLVARRRDELRVDVTVRAAHGETSRVLLGNAHPGFAGAADTSFLLCHV